jgi:hypothetical protein
MTAVLIDRIAEHRAEKAALAMQDFADLALSTEAGTDDVSAVEALRILTAAGKTEADLAKAVNLIRQRRLDAPLAANLPSLAADAAAIEREILALGENFKAAKEQFRIAYDGLLDRQGRIHGQHFEAQKAAARLLDTCQDSRIIGRERLLGVELSALGFERRSLIESLSASGKEGKRLGQLTAEIRQAAPTNYFGIFTSSASRSKQSAAAKQARDEYEREFVAPLRNRLAAIEARIKVINAELAELSKQKLEA